MGLRMAEVGRRDARHHDLSRFVLTNISLSVLESELLKIVSRNSPSSNKTVPGTKASSAGTP